MANMILLLNLVYMLIEPRIRFYNKKMILKRKGEIGFVYLFNGMLILYELCDIKIYLK